MTQRAIPSQASSSWQSVRIVLYYIFQLACRIFGHSAPAPAPIGTDLRLSSSVWPSLTIRSRSLSSSSFSALVMCLRILPSAGICLWNHPGVFVSADSTPSKVAISANTSSLLDLHKTSVLLTEMVNDSVCEMPDDRQLFCIHFTSAFRTLK